MPNTLTMRGVPARCPGPAAVAVLWTTLGLGTARSGFDLLGGEPLSALGTRSASALLFTGGLAAAAVLLVAFHAQVRAAFPVGRGFSASMLAGQGGQVLAAVVPLGPDPTLHSVHTASALVLGASLPLLMWRFAAGQPSGRWRVLSYALFWAEVAACIVGFQLSGRRFAAVAEILPALVFHVWIGAVTVVSGWRSRAPAGAVAAVSRPGMPLGLAGPPPS